MKKLINILFLLISLFGNSQIKDSEIIESNKLNADKRILLHYTYEDILAMDSIKFEVIKYYFCDSYILDTLGVEKFNINKFDISLYERYRKENEFVIIEEKEGLVITLIPINKLIYKR